MCYTALKIAKESLRSIIQLVMESFFEKLLDKYFLSLKSIPLVWGIVILTSLSNIPENISGATWKQYCVIALGVLVAIVYTISCIIRYNLPKGKKRDSSVLFIIDTENHQLFKEVEYKLVSEFEDYSRNSFGTAFEAVCVEKERVHKFDISKSASAIELLEKTNCVFLISVRYSVDSVNNAEHYKMQINYRSFLPSIDEEIRNDFLQTDINNLYSSIKCKKFDKAHLIDEMAFTAITINIICRYIIGLAALLSGRIVQSYDLLHDVYHSILSMGNEKLFPEKFFSILKMRLFFSCIQVAVYYQKQFNLCKDCELLNKMDAKIDEANVLYPNTYDYFLMKAFILVAQDGSMSTVKHCIEMCKKSNLHGDWKYSEAFISAYEEMPGSVIYEKYMKAFAVDHDLLQIADYIEYILDQRPDHISLHLAAGLVYDKMRNGGLAKEHLDIYFKVKDDKDLQKKLIKREKWFPTERA